MIARAAHLLAAVAGAAAAERWPGVDETVVERVAVAAGQQPWSVPFAPEGDALLFAFLVAGLVGGFVLGYAYHALFVAPRRREGRA
jgi:cobalt/nickel transport system permease protein